VGKWLKAKRISVFTTMPYGGNPIWVILGADGLTDGEMKRLASTLDPGIEVVFVLQENSHEANIQLRFFSGTSEHNFSSHAAVASYYAMSNENILNLTEPETEIRQRTKVGLQTVRLRTKTNKITRVTMSLSKPDFMDIEINPLHVARFLGLTVNEILSSGLPFNVVSTGSRDLIVPLKSLNDIRNINPNFSLMDSFCTRVGIQGVTAFCQEVFDTQDNAFMRHFSTALGVEEEPISGDAAGNLGCYLVRHKIVEPKDNFARIIIEQGNLQNKGARIYVHIDCTREQILRVKVGGQAVMTFTGYILAP
jgi:trans-2,3-dihydro-3-hydroxyanthranilate isomerase